MIQPTLLIGLDLEAGLSEQQIQELHSKIGRITQDSLKEQCPVDLIHVNPHSVDGVEGICLMKRKLFTNVLMVSLRGSLLDSFHKEQICKIALETYHNAKAHVEMGEDR